MQLTPKDIPGIIAGAIVVCIFIYVKVIDPTVPRRIISYAFGPEWECLSPTRNNPICFKPSHPRNDGSISN